MNEDDTIRKLKRSTWEVVWQSAAGRYPLNTEEAQQALQNHGWTEDEFIKECDERKPYNYE